MPKTSRSLSKPIKPIEKLARRICWLQFDDTPPKTLGTTEVAYWRGLPDETRVRYVEEARRFIWLERALCTRRSSCRVLFAAQEAARSERR